MHKFCACLYFSYIHNFTVYSYIFQFTYFSHNFILLIFFPFFSFPYWIPYHIYFQHFHFPNCLFPSYSLHSLFSQFSLFTPIAIGPHRTSRDCMKLCRAIQSFTKLKTAKCLWVCLSVCLSVCLWILHLLRCWRI